MLFGAAAQFGIFFTLFLAGFFFDLKDAASIAVIGAADGPTAIFVANVLHSQYLGAIMVAAYTLHGAGPHRAAAGHQTADHPEGAPHPDALPEGQCQPADQDLVPPSS